ncbi:hypothetical protein L2E82_26039 [Cichorium intybus]|uniref:Uncharacterized protein n=1 Tax=Cichorium intybus TaxID=13427 RepID=A0ACB9E5R9_CICIN|nr:hypothetical protein L2E82_26039 [Cichorium intybus]
MPAGNVDLVFQLATSSWTDDDDGCSVPASSSSPVPYTEPSKDNAPVLDVFSSFDWRRSLWLTRNLKYGCR